MAGWIKKRLIERSTWIGFLALAGILGVNISPEQKELIVTIITAVVSLILTVTQDGKNEGSSNARNENVKSGAYPADFDTGE